MIVTAELDCAYLIIEMQKKDSHSQDQAMEQSPSPCLKITVRF